MDIQSILGDPSKLSERELERKFEKFIAANPDRFGELGDKQKEIIQDLISEYKGKARRGISITEDAIKKDTLDLYRQRWAIGLETDDLQLIRELLHSVGDN